MDLIRKSCAVLKPEPYSRLMVIFGSVFCQSYAALQKAHAQEAV